MARILYSGQLIEISDVVDVDELAATILDTVAGGSHAWVSMATMGSNAESVQLLIGPGIPVAIFNSEPKE